MDTLLDLLTWLWSLDGVRFIVAHTLINVVVAVAAALHDGDFQPRRVLDFLSRKLLPFVLVYGAVKVIGTDAGLAWLAPVAFAAIEANLLADLTESLGRLGLPLPERVKNAVTKN